MSADDPPSEREWAFMALLQRPRDFARWAEKVRKDWTAERGRGSTDIGGACPSKSTETASRPAALPAKGTKP